MPDIGDIWACITTIVTVASVVTATTPTPKDDEWLAKIYKWIETLGLVVGRAKDKG